MKDVFVPNIQSVLPPITIPKEFTSTPDASTATVVVDTSSDPLEAQTLQQEIKRASVIWLVYSGHYTCERISLFWMPLFRSMGVNLPVVLCANQCDRSLGNEEEHAIEDEMIPIMKEFKEIQSCIRCSAKEHYNVNEAFYLCQRAVTHPITPLFDSKVNCLKSTCVQALRRIFFLSDYDQDGYLSDREFYLLQVKCFKKTLDVKEIIQLKETLLSSSPTTVTEKGISEEGFILLNQIFAIKGRHETIWGILRAFHYTDSLSLADSFLYPKLDVPDNSSVELSPEGYRFLVDMFVLFDKDSDGGLNDMELCSLFKPTPGIPKLWQEFNFPHSSVRNEAGDISLQGWLAQWSMTTNLDYKTTMEYLALLGFESSHLNNINTQIANPAYSSRKITDALKVTKARKKRNPASRSYRNSTVDRSVFNCYVVGSRGSGKTALLTAFLNRPFTEEYAPTIRPITVVNSVEVHGGKQCYLILEELGELELAVLDNKSRLDNCDILCCTYDSSDPESFAYLVELRKKYPLLDTLPAVYVALKADLDRQQQRSDLQPDVYTRELKMPVPLHVSVQWPSALNELFVQLAEAARNPGPSTPCFDDDEEEFNLMPALKVAGAVCVGAITLSWIWRSYFQISRS